jgi:hypothetical protein
MSDGRESPAVGPTEENEVMLRAIAVRPCADAGRPGGLAEIGDDGLHIAPWIEDTFLDLREDLETPTPQGSASSSSWSSGAASIAQECTRRSSSSLDIAQLLDEEFFVVRLNMHGSLEAVDFDGEAMEERDLVRRWRNMFTPTIHFFRDEVPEGVTGAEAAVVTMPGAFEVGPCSTC